MSKLTKLLTIAFTLLVCVVTANSAVTDYTFSSSSGTYSEITGGDTYGPYNEDEALIDDENFQDIDIGFDFYYEGNTYSSISISTNGYIVMGSTLDLGYYYSGNFTFTGFDDYLIISGFYVDLKAMDNSEIMVLTTGSSPSRVLTIQWKHFKNWSGTTSEDYNFQIKLYETSNKIELVYGTFTVDYTDVVGVGLRGDNNDNYNYRTVASGTNTWATSAAGTSNTSTCGVSSSLYPSSGLTYTFALPDMQVDETNNYQFTEPVAKGAVNQPIIALEMITSNYNLELTATNFQFTTTGTTSVNDITNAKLWYSGSSTYFDDAEQVGSTISAPNGTFNIAIEQELLEGENYFWLTYDIPATATSNNVVDATCPQITLVDDFGVSQNITPAPVSPDGNREIFAPLNGTYTVGNHGDFENLFNAFDYASRVGLSGDATLSIISDIEEPDYASIFEWPEVGDGGYTLTVRPDGNGDWVITSLAEEMPVIMAYQCSDFVLDGSSIEGGTTRELTISAPGTDLINSMAVALVGCDNVTIKNIIANNERIFEYTILNDETRQNMGCIYMEQTSNSTVENCHVYRTNIGISVKYECSDISILNNLVGSTNDGDQYRLCGINLFSGRDVTALGEYSVDGFLVKGNEIYGGFTASTTLTTAYDILRGMLIADALNGVVDGNKVHGIENQLASKGTYGIQVSGYLSTGRDLNVLVCNNWVYNLSSAAYVSGIMPHSQTNCAYLNNTVYMNGNATTGGAVNAMYIHSDVTNIIVKNNILKVTQSGSPAYGMYMVSTANVFEDIDYNCYDIASSGTNNIGYYNGTTATTLSQWQTAISDEGNSVATTVTLKSNTDLHLDGASVANNTFRCPIAQDAEGNNMTHDFDGELRTSSNNVMGADVVTPLLSITQDLTNYTNVFCKDEATTFSFTGAVTGYADGVTRNVSSFPFSYNFYVNGDLIVPDGVNYSITNNRLNVLKLPEGFINYQGEVLSLGGSQRTSIRTVEVQAPIVMTGNPSGAEACVGDASILLSYSATGTITGQQWQKLVNNVWTDLKGKTQHDLYIILDENEIGGWYRVKVIGPGNCPRSNNGPVYSNSVQVVIHQPLANPVLSYSFDPGNICYGEDVYITANAKGTITGYQWQVLEGGEYRDIDLLINSTAQNKTLAIENAELLNSGTYRCMVFGSPVCGTYFDYTEPVVLKVWKLFEIVDQPKPNVLACLDASVMLYVSVEGTVIENDKYIPAYQWYKDDKPIKLVDNPTANNSIFILEGTKFENSGAYHCEIYKEDCQGRGYRRSDNSVVYILGPTEITKQPRTKSASIGGKITFEVKAHVQGAPEDYPISVQWYKGVKPGTALIDDGKYIQGAKSSMLSINDIQNSHYSDFYFAIVTGMCGSVETEYVALKQRPVVTIIDQPVNLAACIGSEASIAVNAESSDMAFTLKYQWKKNGVNLVNDNHYEGVHEATLTIKDINAEDAAGYECYIWIDGEADINATSNIATLTLNYPPSITTQPEANISVEVDSELSILVVATGTDPLTYQWYKDGVEIVGATNAAYVKTAELSDAGAYTCLIKNICNEDGIWSEESIVDVTTYNYSGVDETRIGGYAISANIPNPFSTKTSINYSVAEAANVRLIITDLYGREIAELVNKLCDAGDYTIEVNSLDYGLSSGVYYYSMIVNGNVLTRKMTVVK